MQKLLHIQASPSNAASRSGQVAQCLVEAFVAKSADNIAQTLNVWDLALPPFDATMIAAKFAVLRSQNATQEQKALWERAVALSRAFNEADRFVFSVPMWNFGIPYQFKHYIDVVTLPGENWSWSPKEGYTPLLREKRAVVVYSSAGDYPIRTADADAHGDFQKPFMRKWLKFIGIELIGEIAVSPTLSPPDAVATLLSQSKGQAVRLGALL